MPSGVKIDWSEYDALLIEYLPSLMIVEWRKKYAPHISSKAIGARAKKLGIKPSKKTISKTHKLTISNALSKKLTKYQYQYILENANKLSRKDISRKLKISLYLVNKAFKDLDIKIDKKFQKNIHAKKSRMHVSKATTASKEKWDDEEWRNKRLIEISQQSRKLWKDNKYRAKVLNGIKTIYSNTDLRNRLSEINKKRYEEDDNVKRILHSERPFKTSKLNQRVADVLDSFGIQYIREFQIANYRVDFKIGNIILEVQGDYWHNLPKNQKNDKAKSTIIRKYYPQYNLRYLWESEFKSVRGIDRLLEVIGCKLPDPTIVDLSELKFEQIEKNDLHRKFLDSYHYLGWTNRCSLLYRMSYADSTVIIATFGHPVRQNTTPGKTLELVRLCRNPYFFNRNLCSYFISKCIKEIRKLGKYDFLVSYSDDRLHDGSVYKAANWQLIGKTQSDYEYLSRENIPMHKKTLYNKAKALGLKEKEYAELHGFKKTKIGTKTKFIYTLN